MRLVILLAALVLQDPAHLADLTAFELARLGELEVLKARVAVDPALLTQRDEMRCTLLHEAARYAPIETMAWLLEAGADPTARAYNKFYPVDLTDDPAKARLLFDAMQGRFDPRFLWRGSGAKLELMIERGCEFGLDRALELGDEARVQEILAQGEADEVMLRVAIRHGRLDLVRTLIAGGAKPRAITYVYNAGYANSLTRAVWAEETEIALYLVEEHGVEATPPEGATPRPCCTRRFARTTPTWSRRSCAPRAAPPMPAASNTRPSSSLHTPAVWKRSPACASTTRAWIRSTSGALSSRQ